MGEFFKELANNVGSLMLAIVVLLLAIAIIGFIPLGTDAAARFNLSTWQRLLFALIAVALPFAASAVKYLSNPKAVNVQTTAEYEDRLEASKARNKSITPENRILVNETIRNMRFMVYNADIATAKADVLVSSDDNYFSARGGVAKAILDKAGSDTLRELNYYRNFRPRPAQADLVITTGGDTSARAIIHPAIIDHDHDRYPTKDLIRKVVKRCFACAVAFGAQTIAFPVLGGGTASKDLTPWDSIQAIIAESRDFVEGYHAHTDGQLETIALYIFDKKTIAGDLKELITKPLTGQ